MNRLRSLLSMRSMSLEYSFEPRPKSRAFGTAGLVQLWPLWWFDERKQDWLVQNFGLRRLQRLDAIHESRTSFSPPRSKRRQKEALLTKCSIFICGGSRGGALRTPHPPPSPTHPCFKTKLRPEGLKKIFWDRTPLNSESGWPGPPYLRVWIRYCLWYSHPIVTSLVLISCVG